VHVRHTPLFGFRAESIVADAEMIRQVLVPEDHTLGPRWSILGQSFGGFCAFTYLSFAPEGTPNTAWPQLCQLQYRTALPAAVPTRLRTLRPVGLCTCHQLHPHKM
jgi:hypothetical protein